MPTTTHRAVTAFVRAAMGASGTRLVDLAEALDLSVRSVSARLSGQVSWSVDDVDAIGQKYGHTVEAVLVEGRRWLEVDDLRAMITAETPSSVYAGGAVTQVAEVTDESVLGTHRDPRTSRVVLPLFVPVQRPAALVAA